jgi:hypothetical protein
MHACRRHESQGNFEEFYAACKLHLVNVGRQVGIDDDILDNSLNPDYYEQCVSETLDMMGLFQHYHNANKASNTFMSLLHLKKQWKEPLSKLTTVCHVSCIYTSALFRN